jgi:hypothetical protein
MNTALSRAAEIDRYIDGVAAALADLPDDERQELLEDLPDHLAEIAADDPASLDSRLGPPPAYAAELRAATGVDAAKDRRRVNQFVEAWTTVRPHLMAFDEKVGQLIGYDRLTEFLVLLRPAWWILRGYVVAVVLLRVSTAGGGPWPDDGGVGPLGWVLALVLIGLSIRVGRKPFRMSENARRVWVGAGVAIAVVAAFGLMWIADSSDDVYYPNYGGGDAGYQNPTEVYVYTPEGKPITNIQVYTRNGDTLPIGVPMNCDYRGPEYREQRGCLPTADEETPTAEPSGSGSESAGPGASPSGSPSGGPSGSPSPGPSGSPSPGPS